MNKLTVILSIIVVALLAYIFIFTGHSGGDTDKYAKQKHTIDSLSACIAIQERQQQVQDSIIKKHKDSITALDHEIEARDKKIKDIRKYYGDKIKNTNNLTSAELNSFFADRYK